MGPRSENRGYHRLGRGGRERDGRASMGPRSENRGYDTTTARTCRTTAASMGPRSENRGYETLEADHEMISARLQWVHGPRTVVIQLRWLPAACDRRLGLQWVHGPRTVVMTRTFSAGLPACGFNGSTVREPWLYGNRRRWCCVRPSFNGSTVREPWLCQDRRTGVGPAGQLQWVHGPRTVVMPIAVGADPQKAISSASMGPRSENRGYPRVWKFWCR